jgi:hypothetical protein
MLGEVGAAVEGFVAEMRRVAPDELSAVYLVGGVSLGDFSERQSNVDMVVVADPALTAGQLARLERLRRHLNRANRPADIWVTTWSEIADGPGAAERSGLETPMTRALLRHDAIALYGPDWPVVAYDAAAFKSWCIDRLRSLRDGSNGVMLLRRGVSDLVLEASRLAQGAMTGRVFSKSEAGETVGGFVPPHFRRILTDAVGYRQGANTSMYWGPFERQFDMRVLLRHLLEAAEG